MAVERIGTSVHRFQGLSGDTKPEDDVPIGSTFQEIDGPRRLWAYTTNGWEMVTVVVRTVNTSDFEAALMRELRTQTRLLRRILSDD